MSDIVQNASLIFNNQNTSCVYDIGFKDRNGSNKEQGHAASSDSDPDSDIESLGRLSFSEASDEGLPESKFLQQDVGLSTTLGTVVHDVRGFSSIPSVVASVVESGMESSSFLVCNLATIVQQLVQWREALPMVDPFYAVKCNPDPVIVKLLASLGCSFDCATMGEIDLVCNKLGDVHSFGHSGKAAAGVIYANPAKMDHMLEFARDQGVLMTVFDGEDELYKIARIAGQHKQQKHQFRLLLRITTEDKDSVCRFSKKFGCPYAEAPRLLAVAKKLGLCVAGVSFHVGSGCGDAAAYSTALEHAAQIFHWAEAMGMGQMDIVDIGGGFPGDAGGYGGPGLPTFQQIAAVVRTSIGTFCEGLGRPQSSIRFIAEPGRYFVSACTTIATKIFSRKGGHSCFQALYVDNGVYGSFNTVVYDHAHPEPKRLPLQLKHGGAAASPASPLSGSSSASDSPSPSSTSERSSAAVSRCNSHDSLDAAAECSVGVGTKVPTAVFGPTCDGLDQMCTLESTLLERCEVGDWLYWENQGAYTHTASFIFNGFTHFPNKIHCFMM